MTPRYEWTPASERRATRWRYLRRPTSSRSTACAGPSDKLSIYSGKPRALPQLRLAQLQGSLDLLAALQGVEGGREYVSSTRFASGCQPVPSIGFSASGLGTYRGHSATTFGREAQPGAVSITTSRPPGIHVSALRIGDLLFERPVAGIGCGCDGLDGDEFALRAVLALREPVHPNARQHGQHDAVAPRPRQ